MKCPNCEYEHGWNADTLEHEVGEHGDFWELPINLERGDRFAYYGEIMKADVYGCPKCKFVFHNS